MQCGTKQVRHSDADDARIKHALLCDPLQPLLAVDLSITLALSVPSFTMDRGGDAPGELQQNTPLSSTPAMSQSQNQTNVTASTALDPAQTSVITSLAQAQTGEQQQQQQRGVTTASPSTSGGKPNVQKQGMYQKHSCMNNPYVVSFWLVFLSILLLPIVFSSSPLWPIFLFLFPFVFPGLLYPSVNVNPSLPTFSAFLLYLT